MQRGQQRIEQPAGPGPVGRRPEPVARLREEIMRHFHARQMPGQHAMAVQRAFRLARGARRVDHHRRRVGRGRLRREIGGRLCDRRVEIERAVGRAVDRHNAFQARNVFADLTELRQTLRIGDQRDGAGILQAIGNRIRPEQQRGRQRDRRELVDRDMRGGDFRHLRQENCDAVAAFHALRAQHIGEAIGGVLQPAEGDVVVTAIRMHMHDRDAARIERRPAVADIHADIVIGRNLPAELAIELVVILDLRKHDTRRAKPIAPDCARKPRL